MNDIKVRLPEKGGFPVNKEIAGIVPMAAPAEQAALTASIKEYGQKEPILLWQGKIIDGRCRQKACLELEKPIMYKELDDNKPEEEVKVLVQALNTRRNLTHSQKVMAAAKLSIKADSSVKKQAKAWAVSELLVKNARWIWNTYPDTAQALFDGKAVVIDKGKETTKISPIYAYLRKKSEVLTREPEEVHGWNDESKISTQAGKEWYYTQLKGIEEFGELYTKSLLVDVANKLYAINERIE